MPEANVLYSVTAVVVVGLIAWVVVVLTTAKQPWARPAVAQRPTAPTEDVPVEGASSDAPRVAEVAKADEAANVDEAAKADEVANVDEVAKPDEAAKGSA